MLGHIGVNVRDLSAAKQYYDRLMPLVGYETFFAAGDQLSYLPSGGSRGVYIFLYPALEPGEFSRHQVGLQHLAFMMPTRASVDTLHVALVEMGAEIVHPPQHFPQYSPWYYATFWLDPDGLYLEAVCHKDA